jgi:hypothetical protein
MLVKHKMLIRSCSSGASSGSNRTRSRNAVLSAEGAKVAQQAVAAAATAEASPFVFISKAHRTYRDPGALSGLFFLWNTVQSRQKKIPPRPLPAHIPSWHTTVHNSNVGTNSMAARQVQVIQHAPYWPNLAPADFFLFLRIMGASRLFPHGPGAGHLQEGAGGGCANRHGGGLSDFSVMKISLESPQSTYIEKS